MTITDVDPARMTMGQVARFARFAAPMYVESLTRALTGSRTPGPSSLVPTTDYDPLDPVMFADPYPYYREMLAGPAVHYNPRRRVWIVSHYAAVREALRRPDVFSSADGVLRYPSSAPMMLTTDPPQHTELRRLGTRPFTRGAIKRWKASADELAAEAIAQLVAAPGSDAIRTLAEPIPVQLIAQILGVPAEHHRVFRQWSRLAVQASENTWAPKHWRGLAQTAGATARLHAYLHERLDGADLGDRDTAIAAAADARKAGELDGDGLFLFALLLLIAGNETTSSLLGTLLLNLAENPDQYELLRAQPELVPAAVEEQVRHGSPVQGLYRSALADHEFDGIVIPAGARVLLLFAAANRDPRYVEHPDRFDLTRTTTDHPAHLGFGHGIHMCLGAPLARMEGQVVLRRLLDSVERITLDGPPDWNTNGSLRGLRSLRVTLHPAPRATA